MIFRLSIISLAMLLAGCISLDPDYQRPAAPVPAVWPAQGAQPAATTVLSDWQGIMADARLNAVVAKALTSNRDLQEAIADIEAAKALYGEQRASLFPTLDAELSQTRSRTQDAGVSSSATADGAVSSFEIDLFGRNRSLSTAAKKPGWRVNRPRRTPV